MNNDIEFLNTEEHDIPSQILKTNWDCMSESFLDHKMGGFWHICMLAWSQTLVVNWQN